MTSPSLHLPSYKKEKAFRVYEPIIAHAVDLYPSCFEQVPTSSLETFNSRFRYALQSGVEFGYPSALIDQIKYLQVASKIKCVMRNGCCLIGSAGAIKTWDEEHSKFKGTVLEVQTPLLQTVEMEITFNGTNKELASLVLMLANKCFSPPPTFWVENLSETSKKEIELLADVIFEPDESIVGRYKII